MTTLFGYLKETYHFHDRLWNALNQAYDSFIEAKMRLGSKKVEAASLASQPIPLDINIEMQSGILGIVLPRFQLTKKSTGALEPRFNLLDTSAKLDESFLPIIDTFHVVTKLAEKEASIREVLDVISFKQRQVNRLQYKVLPQLNSAIKYIELILEETERQDAIRVRILQRKRKEHIVKSS